MTAYKALMTVYPFGLEDLLGEIWLPIPDWEDYHVSNFGRVKSFKYKTPRIMKPIDFGYLRVDLYKGNKHKYFLVHRLVAKAFIPNPEEKREVNHIDGNKLNNFVGNLEWATRSENIQHAFDTGLKVNPQGEERPDAKLTNEQARYIRANPDNLNLAQLAEIFGVNQTTISEIQRGKRYKMVSGTIRQSKVSRISDDLRNQIKAEYKRGVRGFGCKALAKKYGIGGTTVTSIVREG